MAKPKPKEKRAYGPQESSGVAINPVDGRPICAKFATETGDGNIVPTGSSGGGSSFLTRATPHSSEEYIRERQPGPIFSITIDENGKETRKPVSKSVLLKRHAIGTNFNNAETQNEIEGGSDSDEDILAIADEEKAAPSPFLAKNLGS